MSDGEDDFEINRWFSDVGLSVAAATKVKTAQIEDQRTLLLMCEVDVLKLSLGNTLRLERVYNH